MRRVIRPQIREVEPSAQKNDLELVVTELDLFGMLPTHKNIKQNLETDARQLSHDSLEILTPNHEENRS